MIDGKKVMEGLSNIRNEIVDGYINDPERAVNTLTDALELLKEQEPVKPEQEHSGGGTTWWNVCGACRTAINPNDKYCHECGRAIDWNLQRT